MVLDEGRDVAQDGHKQAANGSVGHCNLKFHHEEHLHKAQNKKKRKQP